MEKIGAFEAKNKFAEILRRVEAGEEFCVTRHGKIVAQISSPHPSTSISTKEAFARLRTLRKKLRLTPEEIAAFRAEGRP
jgi:prevent-host-death family protein